MRCRTMSRSRGRGGEKEREGEDRDRQTDREDCKILATREILASRSTNLVVGGSVTQLARTHPHIKFLPALSSACFIRWSQCRLEIQGCRTSGNGGRAFAPLSTAD